MVESKNVVSSGHYFELGKMTKLDNVSLQKPLPSLIDGLFLLFLFFVVQINLLKILYLDH